MSACLGYTGLVTTSLAIWLETIALQEVPAAEMRYTRSLRCSGFGLLGCLGVLGWFDQPPGPPIMWCR